MLQRMMDIRRISGMPAVKRWWDGLGQESRHQLAREMLEKSRAFDEFQNIVQEVVLVIPIIFTMIDEVSKTVSDDKGE